MKKEVNLYNVECIVQEVSTSVELVNTFTLRECGSVLHTSIQSSFFSFPFASEEYHISAFLCK